VPWLSELLVWDIIKFFKKKEELNLKIILKKHNFRYVGKLIIKRLRYISNFTKKNFVEDWKIK